MKTIVSIWFAGHIVPGGVDAILGPTQCGPDVAKIEKYEYGKDGVGVRVYLTLDDGDERVAKVLALLAPHERLYTVNRRDIYTEEELQNARLLCVGSWAMHQAASGLPFGTTYDLSNACKQCGTGVRQTSPLVIDGEDERIIEKMHIAGGKDGELLIPDVLGEKLANAKLAGLNLSVVHKLRKDGTKVELRREQILAENVLPPMAPASSLNRTKVCPVCQRGRFNFVAYEPARVVYRAVDLKNMQDFNQSWEWFGTWGKTSEDVLNGVWPTPLLLVTPKVMNLLRGKTKKEKKYEGVSFTPIWIEDENGQPTLATGKNVEMGAPTSETPTAKPAPKRGSKRRSDL
jgi:hypothetical protein